MTKRLNFRTNLIIFGLWLVTAAVGVALALQIHTLLLTIGLVLIRTPALRPPGWNIYTLHGLSRFLYLVVGLFWLFAIMFLEGYLREAVERDLLKKQTLKLLGALVGSYFVSYLIVLLLTLFL